MVELYGQELSRREVEERAGTLTQFAGVRLMKLSDGAERSIRMVEFRTGSGLRFTVLVDRAMGIGDCEYRGQSTAELAQWPAPSRPARNDGRSRLVARQTPGIGAGAVFSRSTPPRWNARNSSISRAVDVTAVGGGAVTFIPLSNGMQSASSINTTTGPGSANQWTS